MIEKLYPTDHPISKPLLLGNHVFPGFWRYIFPKDISQIKFPKEQKSACMNWRIKKLELNVHGNDINRGLYVSNVSNYNVQKSFWSKRKECCKPDRKSYRISSNDLKNEYNSESQGKRFESYTLNFN